MPRTKPVTGRMAHIDATRAFAVALVVIAHAGLGAIVPGGAGVTVFFTISGFIITFILLRERKQTGRFNMRAFYYKRFLKLAPPLFVAIIVPTLLYSFYSEIDFTAFFGQLLFYYNWLKTHSDPLVLPGSGITWSLGIEEQFYIGFAVIWIFASKYNQYKAVLWIVASLSVVYSILVRLFIMTTSQDTDRIYYGTDTRLDSIAIGIMCALIWSSWRLRSSPNVKSFRYWFKRSWLLPTGVLLFLAATLVPGDFYRYTFRFSLQSVAVGMVLLYGLRPSTDRLFVAFQRLCSARIVQVIGLASYSIYLVHLPMYQVVEFFLPDLDLWISVPVKVGVGLLVGVLIWKFIEHPVERYKASIYGRSRRFSQPSVTTT